MISRLKANKDKIVLVLLSLWFLGTIFTIFYLFSYIITVPGSLFLFLILMCLFLHTITRIATFPGAYPLWRRTIEKSCSQNICSNLSKKLEILNSVLMCIQDSAFSQIYDRISFHTLKSIPKTFTRTIKTLEGLSLICSSTDQQQFLALLKTLDQSLHQIKFFHKSTENNLHSFLSSPVVYREVNFTESEELMKSAIILDRLYRILQINLKQPEGLIELIQSFNWRKPLIFGSLDYMRCELIEKLKAEQFWLTSADGYKIDCLWVPGATKNTVIYCNPNGGFYEFTSLQNEWVEFYLELGFNVVLWNYRGYGRSQGNPDILYLASDGECVFRYVKDIKNSEKIMVHGQSLGGSVAARLGKVADFIFADRTFRGLSDVALFNYGKVAYRIYKIFGPSESDAVKDYIAANCYKLISCDCEDAMIPHLASLKAGVILSLKENQRISGLSVFKLLKSYKEIPEFAEIIKCLGQVRKFKPADEEESQDVDIIGMLCSLEVHGRSLYRIGKQKQKELEMILWLCTNFVYSECMKATKATIEDIVKILEAADAEAEVGLLRSIIRCLQELLDIGLSEIAEDFSNSGVVMPISCGHNSVFSQYELYIYKLHLQNSNMLPKHS